MHRAIIAYIFAIALATSSQAEPLEWDAKEKMLLGGIVAANCIDVYQTHYLTYEHRDEYAEVNPITRELFGEHVEWHKLALYKAAVLTPMLYYAVHKWPRNHLERKAGLWLIWAVSLMPVIHNENISGGVVFKF